MKKIIKLFLFLSLAFTQAQTIKVGTSGGYYPFTYYENDELKGFDIDVFKAVAKHLKLKVEFKTAKFSGLFGMLESSKIDTIANEVTITKKRKEKYNFSIPYAYDGASIVVHKDNKNIKSIKDLIDKKVGLPLGTNFEELIKKIQKEELNNAKINFIYYDTGGSKELDVVLKRTDAFIQDRLSAIELIRNKGLPLKVAGKPISIMENAFVFLKDKKGKKLLKDVNKALKHLKKNGTLKKISLKWFKEDISTR